MLVSHRFLTIAKDGRLELYRTWLISTMHVTECRSEEEATNRLECFVNFDHVFGCGVEFFCRKTGCVVTVFFAADAACFNFEDDI